MAKFWLTFVALIVSIILLLPSLVPESSSLASYLPGKKLSLGLDLRGGIHIVLGVEIQKAWEVELDRLATSVDEQLKEKGLVGYTVERNRSGESVVVKLRDINDQKAFEDVLASFFYGTLEVSTREGALYSLVLNPDHKTQLGVDSLEQARDIIRNRVDEFGVAEPIVQKQGADRILVQLPGIQDPERAIQLLGKTALLEFKVVDSTMDPEQLDGLIARYRDQVGFRNQFTRTELEALNQAMKSELPVGTLVSFERLGDSRSREVSLRPYLLKAETVLTGNALEDARVTSDTQTEKPQVSLRFSQAGAQNFEKITEANVGQLLAIVLDGVVVSAPVIREKIPAASAGATISLGTGNRQKMYEEARDLALVLRSGALPAPVEILENRTVGASLGKESIDQGMTAGLLGALFIVVFMILYYRWSGVLANWCLLINISMLLAIMALFQATLTLPGIAGIVLTVGMAVDSNVVIIERIRDELRSGRKTRAALEAGFEGAHRALFDSNLTTIIAGIVLYNFGTGPIRGFAVTLIVGLICNYIASVWFSRWIYEWFLDSGKATRLSV